MFAIGRRKAKIQNNFTYLLLIFSRKMRFLVELKKILTCNKLDFKE